MKVQVISLAETIVQLVGCVPSILSTSHLVLSLALHKPGMVVNSCHPSTQESEASNRDVPCFPKPILSALPELCALTYSSVPGTVCYRWLRSRLSWNFGMRFCPEPKTSRVAWTKRPSRQKRHGWLSLGWRQALEFSPSFNCPDSSFLAGNSFPLSAYLLCFSHTVPTYCPGTVPSGE